MIYRIPTKQHLLELGLSQQQVERHITAIEVRRKMIAEKAKKERKQQTKPLQPKRGRVR
jgi:hypothetical protein